MYNLKMVDNSDDKSIIDFEKRRLKAFGTNMDINKVTDSSFGRTIKKGDALAFNCFDDDTLIGGMLISTMFGNIYLDRLFVDYNNRGKGAGKYMVNYLLTHQDFFNDYFGSDSEIVLVEPTDKTMDFYYNLGFNHSGYQMYKRY